MRRVELTRAQFVDWLGNPQRDTSSLQLAAYPSAQTRDVCLVWQSDAMVGEPIIAVAASEMREFLAFTSTYVGTYSPFTAFFRVVPRELVELLPVRRVPGASAETRPVRALLGAVIADAAAQIGGGAVRVGDISVQASLATPSAVVATAAILGYDTDIGLIGLERWHSVRSALGGGASKLTNESLRRFWSTVLPIVAPEGGGARSLDPAIERFIGEAVRESGISERSWAAIAPHAGSFEYRTILRGSREDRVRVLEKVLSSPTRDMISDHRDILFGYIAAQVAEGSFNYLPLAARMLEQHPIAMLWFGLFSGANTDTDVLTAGDCLGRRVFRQLNPGTVGLPPIQADIGLEELLMFAQENRTAKFRTDQLSFVSVELLPGVAGRFRSARNATPSRETDADRNGQVLDNARRLVAQLQNVLREAPDSKVPGTLFETEPTLKTPARKRAVARKSRTN